jgi:uncharacterized protein (TIGR02145 family)
MKTIHILLLFIIPFITFSQVGIGTNVPESSAQLDVNSSTRGFLPPRLTMAERNAIVSPANGLQIFNTTTGCINYYIGTGWQEVCGTAITDFYPVNSVFCASGPTAVVDVTNPTTGKTWMDRNLGATQKATSSSDAAAYGDLYQWGRRSDGHQCRTSATTSTLSSSDQPGHGNFIKAQLTSPWDWRSPQNTNLWQGANGVNNPCPIGYRIPSSAELNSERLSWNTNTSTGAFGSLLAFPVAGDRVDSDGSLSLAGTFGYYWSSSFSGVYSSMLRFNISFSDMMLNQRGYGHSIRCIKN